MTWRDLTACRDTPTEVFFVDRGQNATEAKAICAGCPVRRDCLDDALATREPFGIRGGKSPRERGVKGGAPHAPRAITHGTEGGYLSHLRRDERPCRDCLDAHHSAMARRGVAS